MKTYAYFLRYALLALPLVCAFALSSCYNDEDGDCPGGNEPVEVRLNVSAQQIGDLNGTRAGGDGLADEHEFMHSLRVYIVNEAGSVMQSFVRNPAALEAYSTAASTGDLTNWSSESFELAPGEYTVYAFANFEGHEGFADGENSAQLADNFIHTCFPDDGTVNTRALNSFTIADPVGKIKFVSDGSGEVVYIPMSASQRITVTANTHDISIGLVRLVGKVQLTVSPDNAEIGQDATVTFSNYSENVPLMAASTTSSHGERKATTPAMPLLEDATLVDGSYQLSFYVNETPNDANQGFTVTLNTGDTSSGGISEYRAITDRTEIPRNHVYPLSLMFPEYEPDFDWNSWAAPIGDYTPVVTEPEPGTYTVDIAEGAQFEFIVTGMNGGTLDNAVWNVPQELAAFMTDMSRDNNALSAALSAGVGVGTQIPLTVTVTWTDNVGEIGQRTMTRTYNVIINTVDITDIKFETQSNANSTRSGASGSYWLNREYLNMFKLK